MSKFEIDTDQIESLTTVLARILEAQDLNEIEITQGETTIRIVRERPQIQTMVAPSLPAANIPATESFPSTSQTNDPSNSPTHSPAHSPANPDHNDHSGSVKSPMVGTVYLAPQSDAPPFITIGAQVSEGQTLLIIEAMKVMNPIVSPITGVIKDILVENAEPVEFDQPLVIIE